MTPETLDRTATIAGAVLTLMVFSYLLGDNFLYRIAIHVFIGAAAAYCEQDSDHGQKRPIGNENSWRPAAPTECRGEDQGRCTQ